MHARDWICSLVGAWGPLLVQHDCSTMFQSVGDMFLTIALLEEIGKHGVKGLG